MSNWIKDTEAALSGADVPPGVERVPPHRPQLVDANATRAIVAPFLAAFFGAVAYFREQQTGQPFDPIAVVMRVLALAMVVRTVLLGRELMRRMRILATADGFALALSDDGLLVRRPEGDIAVPKADILAVKERGLWSEQAVKRWNDVYVITRPQTGRPFVALPPLFDRTPGSLAERLMRWRGPLESDPDYEVPPPSKLPSKVFDQAAAGDVPSDVTVIRHGQSWLRRAPYATVLLGTVILDGFVRLPAATRDAVGPVLPGLIAFSLLVVPLFWTLAVRHDIRPRKGLSLVLTPSEMLMRTREGVHVVRWNHLERLSIDSRRRWSLLLGAHAARTLRIEREGSDDILYDETFLGAPAEVVVALCDAYRRGQITAGPS